MRKIKLKLEACEIKIIINCLNEMRNKLISEKRDPEAINELILKCIDVLENNLLELIRNGQFFLLDKFRHLLKKSGF